MADIRINLVHAQRQAQRLDEAASQLRRELRNLSSAQQNISSYWDGTASKTFVQKINEQYSDLIRLCQQIENIADDIRNVAERIKRQEEAMEQAAQKL